MRRDLCQMWNCSPAELAQMDARTVIDTVGYAVEETEEERANVHDAA